MATPMLRFISAAITDRGLSEKRPLNEDSYLEMVERGLFAVADGVGGAQAGDVASQMAMEVLYEAFSNPQNGVDTEDLMEMAIQRANSSIYRMSQELPQLDMMATTIVALRLEGNIATIGHVGDSRLYRLSFNGNLFRETQDHSVVEEEVRAGRMTPQQAANHPSRNVISRALGAEETVEVDMKTIMFDAGTTFLLCSDGVTRHLPDHEIRELLLKHRDPVNICRMLKAICYERGAEDNLTAVVIQVHEAGQAAETEDETTIAGVRPAVAATQPFVAETTNNIPVAPVIAEVPTVENLAAAQAQSLNNRTIEVKKPLTSEQNTVSPPTGMDQAQIASQEIPLGSASPVTSKVSVSPASPVQYEETTAPKAKKGFSILPWLISLIIFLPLGVLIGVAGFSALSWFQSQQAGSTLANKPQIPQPTVSQTDITITNFEKLRREAENMTSVPPAFENQNEAEMLYLKGRIELKNGNIEKAKEYFKKSQEAIQAGHVDPINEGVLKSDLEAFTTLVNSPDVGKKFPRKTPQNTNTNTNTNMPSLELQPGGVSETEKKPNVRLEPQPRGEDKSDSTAVSQLRRQISSKSVTGSKTQPSFSTSDKSKEPETKNVVKTPDTTNLTNNPYVNRTRERVVENKPAVSNGN